MTNKEGLLDNIYGIKDLYIVLFKEDYKKYLMHKDDMATVFNPNFYFVVEKFRINKGEGLPYNSEIYTECVTSEDIYKRESGMEWQTIPPLFKEMYPVPKEYFTEEEIASGKVTSTRVFQIFQEYNLNSLSFKEAKVKTLGGLK